MTLTVTPEELPRKSHWRRHNISCGGSAGGDVSWMGLLGFAIATAAVLVRRR